jgi:uncharacterized protein YdeI (YjbR/CyaY-like superfamily)
MKKINTVEDYIAGTGEWTEALEKLRSILLDTEMEETVKWGAPVYTIDGKNVVGIGAFKSYCGLWFYQGVFLKDKEQVLVNAQEGKTKALRQWRFNSTEEMDEKLIRKYVLEAIENQRAGLELKPEKKKLELPDELALALKTNADLNKNFQKLTPGRQKEYAEYIAEAKRAETRQSRLEKCEPLILKGIGLNDKYRDC